MLNKRLKLNLTVLGFLTLFAAIALVPVQAQAAMSYGGWELDGFFRNNTGIWTESWTYAPNNDPLATCRNWFRLNLNGKISNSLRLKAEILAIYEPEYHRETNGAIEANEYNYFDFRELRLDWRPKMGHNIRFGRAIVNWGEALTGRVGDVINPVDGRWDLGFTNLEDTRMPIWMIRGIHQFYSIGTSIDWIFSPYLQHDYWRRSRTIAWPATALVTNGVGGVMYTGVGMDRFSIYPEEDIIVGGVNLNTPAAPLPPGFPVLYGSYQNAIYGGFGTGNLVFKEPGSDLASSRFGFKTSSTIMGAQTGVYFWRAHSSAWSTSVLKYNANSGNVYNEYPRVNYFGFYANKNYDFGVLRTDICYSPDYEVSVLDWVRFPDGTGEIDKLKVQFGYNKDFMIRALNEFQTFGLIIEYIGEFMVGGDKDDALWTYVYHTPMEEDYHQIAVSFGTNYNFGMYAPNITAIYTSENNGLLQLKFDYTPDWMNRKWKFTLQYNNLFADEQGDWLYGILEDRDMLLLTTQFSFP